MFKMSGLIYFFLVLSSSTAFAENPKSDDMRCEKLIATPLADFKAALVENCNLNKPFSSSLSRVLNDEVYFYCCHKK